MKDALADDSLQPHLGKAEIRHGRKKVPAGRNLKVFKAEVSFTENLYNGGLGAFAALCSSMVLLNPPFPKESHVCRTMGF